MVREVASGTVSGGRAVVEALVAAGVDHAFLVPGESFLGVLDALYDEPRIRVVATRHEGGAAFMAEAYGQLTHRPAAFEQALAADLPALLHIRVAPDQISVGADTPR